VAFLRALKAIEKLVGANDDQTTGIKILARSIEEPLRQIVANTGEDAAVVLNTSMRMAPLAAAWHGRH
jgi:chaperonin GroEL